MVTYTKPRLGAIAAGALCALGAAAVLFEDVRHTHAVTTDHLLSVLVLVGTITAGVMAVDLARAWRTWHYAIALTALAAVGSVYCVMTTAGRTAESRAVKQLEAEAVNTARAGVVVKMGEAEAMLDEQRRRLAAECASGAGKRCDGIRRSVEVYEAAVKGHAADLAALGPELPVNVRAKNAAAMVAAMTGGDEAAIAAAVGLLEPNIPALFAEAGSILFLHIGFAGWRRTETKPDRGAAELAELRRRFFAPDVDVEPPAPVDPKPRRRRGTPDERRRQVADFRAAFVARHGREPEPRDIRAGLGLPRRASHSYLREIVAA